MPENDFEKLASFVVDSVEFVRDVSPTIGRTAMLIFSLSMLHFASGTSHGKLRVEIKTIFFAFMCVMVFILQGYLTNGFLQYLQVTGWGCRSR